MMDRIAEARRNITPSGSVCRCLFGPLDREQNRQFLKDFNAQNAKEMADMYNFDFITESPMRGKYDWVKVDEQENISQAYKLPHLMSHFNREDTLKRQIPRSQADSNVQKPKSQRVLAFSQGAVSFTQSSPVYSSEDLNNEQCSTGLISPQTTEPEEAIDNTPPEAKESRNDLFISMEMTESPSRKRGQRTIPEFFSIRKKSRQEEKTD